MRASLDPDRAARRGAGEAWIGNRRPCIDGFATELTASRKGSKSIEVLATRRVALARKTGGRRAAPSVGDGGGAGVKLGCLVRV